MKIVITSNHDFTAGWVSAKTGYIPGGRFTTVGLVESDGFRQRYVAGCVFDNFDGVNVVGHIACCEPVTRGFVRAIHAVPYEVMGARRITAFTDAENTDARDFLTRLGFSLEGRVRKALRGGDRLVYGQLREEAGKWLNLNC